MWEPPALSFCTITRVALANVAPTARPINPTTPRNPHRRNTDAIPTRYSPSKPPDFRALTVIRGLWPETDSAMSKTGGPAPRILPFWPHHAPDDFLRGPLPVGHSAPAFHRRGGPARCPLGPCPRLLHSPDRPARIGPFRGFFHRVLGRPAPHGLDRSQPRIRRLHRHGRDRSFGPYAGDRPICLVADAGRLGPLRRGLLHGDRGMVAGQGHQPDPGPHHGRLPGGGHGRIPGRANADFRIGTSVLRLLQPAGPLVLRRPSAAYPLAPQRARNPRRPAPAPDAPDRLLAPRSRRRSGGRFVLGLVPHGGAALRRSGRPRRRPDRGLSGGLRAGRRGRAVPRRLACRPL